MCQWGAGAVVVVGGQARQGGEGFEWRRVGHDFDGVAVDRRGNVIMVVAAGFHGRAVGFDGHEEQAEGSDSIDGEDQGFDGIEDVVESLADVVGEAALMVAVRWAAERHDSGVERVDGGGKVVAGDEGAGVFGDGAVVVGQREDESGEGFLGAVHQAGEGGLVFRVRWHGSLRISSCRGMKLYQSGSMAVRSGVLLCRH